MLAAICAPVLTHRADGGLVVDYRELPQALWTKILPHFGVDCSDRDRAAMVEAARLDAKSPCFAFAPDSEAKQQAASASVRAAAARLVIRIANFSTCDKRVPAGSPSLSWQIGNFPPRRPTSE